MGETVIDNIGSKAIFAVASICNKGDETLVTRFVTRAHNEAESDGIALAHAREVYPPQDDYWGHQVTSLQIDDEWIKLRAKWLEEQRESPPLSPPSAPA